MSKLFTTVFGIVALCIASVIQATPIYTGLTEADFGIAGLPGLADSNDAGYYLWTTGGDTWSVRWTGNDNGASTSYDWFGYINLVNLVDGSVTEVRFENAFSSNVWDMGGLDFIVYSGVAGSGYDGIDFKIDKSTFDVVDFALGSSLFSGLLPSATEVLGSNIYIGQNFNAPKVQVQNFAGGIVQRFEVAPVPESGTLALLVIGLLGFGFSHRRTYS